MYGILADILVPDLLPKFIALNVYGILADILVSDLLSKFFALNMYGKWADITFKVNRVECVWYIG